MADTERGKGGGEAVGEEVQGGVGEGRLMSRAFAAAAIVLAGSAGDDGGTVAVLGDYGGKVLGDGALEEWWLDEGNSERLVSDVFETTAHGEKTGSSTCLVGASAYA
jgi:hypothetical protein